MAGDFVARADPHPARLPMLDGTGLATDTAHLALLPTTLPTTLPAILPGVVDLLAGTQISQSLAQFAPAYPNGDPRAVASVWSKAILRLWLVPVLSFEFWHGLRIWQAQALHVSAGTGGIPGRIWLPAPMPGGDLDALITQGLWPFVRALSCQSGLSQRVIWGNIGNLWEALSRAAAGDAARLPGHAGLDLLARRRLPSGAPNPLYQTIRYKSPESGDTDFCDTGLCDTGNPLLRQRRVCCLRDRLVGQTRCASCPNTA